MNRFSDQGVKDKADDSSYYKPAPFTLVYQLKSKSYFSANYHEQLCTLKSTFWRTVYVHPSIHASNRLPPGYDVPVLACLRHQEVREKEINLRSGGDDGKMSNTISISVIH